MERKQVYDLIGIGIGPFNLGLAALTDQVSDVEALFFEQEGEFDWHPGMLIDGAHLQNPFLADLVTFADPTSPYTYIHYLHRHNRLYQFFFFQRFEVPRTEYNAYLKWVASQLDHCRFGRKVIDVHDKDSHYEVVVEDVQTGEISHYQSRHIVLGTGSIPNIPDGFEDDPDQDVLHTSVYMDHKRAVQNAPAITIIGSGQSAAEVFYDLLQEQPQYGYDLHMLTAAPGIFQLDTAKLSQEMFSPDFVDYFHQLSFEQRLETLPSLDRLRKGISPETLVGIYELLYHRSSGGQELPVTIQPMTNIEGIERSKTGNGYVLHAHQWQQDERFEHETHKVILATGYQPHIPRWLDQFAHDIIWEDEERYRVSRDYKIKFKQERDHHIFTLTNLEHSHGAGATNLGLSVQRNQTILNAIAGREVYPVPRDTIFQQFGP